MTTLRAVVFGDGSTAQAVEQAAERLAGAGAVPARPQAPPLAFARAVMTRVADLLNIEVSDVLVGAWRTRSAILDAARESVRTPNVAHPVTVRSYTFPWEHDADLEVTLNRTTLATLTITTSVEFSATALAAVLYNGRLTAVTGGDCVVGAAVRVSSRTAVPLNAPLAHGERKLPLAYELSLPAGGLSLVD